MSLALRTPAEADSPRATATISPRGALYSFSAYALWGVYPLYFRALEGVAPFEIVLHRAVWSVFCLSIVLTVKRHWSWLVGALRDRRIMRGFVASAAFLSINWFIYIWSVDTGHVVDASLGYFINPLANVLFGVLFLKERLRRVQWLAIGIAAMGVLWLTLQSGNAPWIGLSLATTFGMYGFLRKTAALGALEGLVLETLLLFPFAASYLGWLMAHGQSRLLDGGAVTQLLLVSAGPLTVVPLLLFAAGARRIPMSLMGLLQYASPTLQLAVGVLVFHEPFKGAKIAGFSIIWAALALYTAEGLVLSRRPMRRSRA